MAKKDEKAIYLPIDKQGDKSRTIIHTNMDVFHGSIEMLGYSELCSKAVVVGGSSNRSVVSTASYDYRKFGIHWAVPPPTTNKLCPEAISQSGRNSQFIQTGSIYCVAGRSSVDEAFDLAAIWRIDGPAYLIVDAMNVGQEGFAAVNSTTLARLPRIPAGTHLVPPGV
ncbi:MAG: hypothetical protein ABFS18_06065 [Thermodesulfobacteriota bacterium]